jgi:hypothetical protein
MTPHDRLALALDVYLHASKTLARCLSAAVAAAEEQQARTHTLLHYPDAAGRLRAVWVPRTYKGSFPMGTN